MTSLVLSLTHIVLVASFQEEYDSCAMMSKVFRNVNFKDQMFEILDTLISEPFRKPGQFGKGVTVTGDHPSRKSRLLNVKRPAVLRVPHGELNMLTHMIPTYGVGTGSFTVGTSPR